MEEQGPSRSGAFRRGASDGDDAMGVSAASYPQRKRRVGGGRRNAIVLWTLGEIPIPRGGRGTLGVQNRLKARDHRDSHTENIVPKVYASRRLTAWPQDMFQGPNRKSGHVRGPATTNGGACHGLQPNVFPDFLHTIRGVIWHLGSRARRRSVCHQHSNT